MRMATAVYTQKIWTAGMDVMAPTLKDSPSVSAVIEIEMADSDSEVAMRSSTCRQFTCMKGETEALRLES